VDLTTAALTLLALIAFASNSLLTRLALGGHSIDAATFTAIRLASGALVLCLLALAQAGTRTPWRRGGLVGPGALFAYAALFSFAYLRIGAAVGALVLFGVVQLTMIGYGMIQGERPSFRTWVGVTGATAGLVILTWPSTASPDPWGLLLMALAGAAWGVYSLAGRSAGDPVAVNARSFLWSTPMALVLLLIFRHLAHLSGRGIILAVVSGGVTSGLGYAIWYRALPRLSVTQAAVAQLSVPVIASIGAAALLHETVSTRLIVSALLVLAGVALVLSTRTTAGLRGVR
jgi:drug/metabolite transporter (DMT)-like permease